MESSLLLFILALVLGGLLLFFGMRLFWLSVGIIGFGLGVVLATAIAGSATSWITIVVGLGVGVVFAILAVVAQKPLAAVAGFIAAGGAAVAFADFWLGMPTWSLWLLFVVFGLAGAFIAWWMFVPAVIFITSFCGASVIVNALETRLAWGATVFLIIWAALVVTGLIYQLRMRRRHIHRQSAMRVDSALRAT